MDRKILEELMTRAARAFALKDFESAKKYAIDVTQKAPHAASPHILLGTIFGNQGDYPRAIESFTRARQLRPRNIEALNNLGVMYRFAGDLEKAGDVLKEAAKIAKRRPDIYYNLGNVYKQKGDFPEALAAYQQALELDPDFILAYNNMGTLYEQRGDYESALAIYDKGLAADPNHPTILYNRGVALQHLNRLEEAEEQFKKAIIQRPGWVDAMNNLGVTRQQLDKLDEAEEVFQAILKSDPDNPRARNNLATTYARQGRNEEAIDLFKRALAASPQYDRAAVNLGKLLEQTDPEGGALAEIETLYRARPENPELAYQYAQSLRKKENYEEAKQVLNPFTSSGTQTPEMDFLLGIIALKQGHEDTAEDFFFRARRKMRESTSSGEHSHPILLEAKAWHEGGLTDKGTETLEEYLKDRPTDTAVRKLLSEMLMSIRQEDRAVVLLQNLKLDAPDDTEVLSLLARCYQRLGQKSDALETVDELVSVQGQRATSDDLSALNKSLELYEQAVAAYQAEHGDAWERSLESLGRLNTAAQEEDILGAESLEALEEDTVPLLEFGDEESLLDQDLLQTESLVEDLADLDEEESEAPIVAASGSSAGPGAGSSGGSGKAEEGEAADESYRPRRPAEAPFMEMVEDQKIPIEDFDAPPVSRTPSPEPQAHPQQALPPQPPFQPQQNQWPEQPQYPPPQQPQQPPMPQYQAQQPQYPPPQQPQYPPTPPEPQFYEQPAPQSPQAQSPQQTERHPTQEPSPQQPRSQAQSPQPTRSPERNTPQMPPYSPPQPPEPEPAPRPAPPSEAAESENSYEAEVPEENILPEDTEIHLEDDFLPDEPAPVDGEAEPVEMLQEDSAGEFDLEQIEDEDPELERVEADAKEGESVEQAELAPMDSADADETDSEADEAGAEEEEVEGIGATETLSEEVGIDEGLDSENQAEEVDLAAGEVGAGEESVLTATPEAGEAAPLFSEAPKATEMPTGSALPGPSAPPASQSAGNGLLQASGPMQESGAPRMAAEESGQRSRRAAKAPVQPEQKLGLLDYLMSLTQALPESVGREFRESGAAERMQRVRDSLADAAKQKKSEEPGRPSRNDSPLAGKSPSTKEQAPANGEGIGKAFALIADLSKVLPDEQGTAIRDRMKKIYRKMEAIRKRDGLD